MEDLEVDLGITRRYYDRISRVYDALTDGSEHAIRDCGIEALALSAGERVLEIGFGTGHGLVAMARAIGLVGLVCGVDISTGRAAIAAERVDRETCRQVQLVLGDARALCLAERAFDAIFFSFTLERFGERRGACSCPAGGSAWSRWFAAMEPGSASSVYQWMHHHFPHAIDCAPIDVGGVMAAAGFSVEVVEATRMWTLPVTAVVGRVLSKHVD